MLPSVAEKEKKDMAERVIKAALLGFGTVGGGVYTVLKMQQEEMVSKLGARVELKKILVRNIEKAAQKTDDPSLLTNNWKEIVDDPEIEIVIELIGGIEPARTYILEALEAGKNVIVEKPFTATAEQGQELVDLARSKGLAISVYQNRRWDSDFLTVREILNKGLLGRLVEFESTFPRYRNFIKPGTWKETGELGGGLTYNLGAHIIDQAVQLLGVPDAVFADIDTIRTGGMVDDYFVIHLLRPSKAPRVKVTLKSSYLMCEPEPRFILHGTEGSFVKYGLDRQEADLNDGQMPGTPYWGVEDESTWGLLHTEKDGNVVHYKYPSLAGNYAGFYDNIYRHLRHGEPLLTDAADVLLVIRLIEAAWKSSKEGNVVKL